MDVLGPYARRALGESRRQCTATNRDGQRCGRWAALGAFVCKSHGGGAPQVMSAAKRRLQALVDPAMEALLRALETGPPCAACGRSDSDRDPNVLKAAQLVLDRAGFPASVAVDVNYHDGSGEGDWVYHVTADEMAQFMSLKAAAIARMHAAPDDDDVIDIEVAEREAADANRELAEARADMGAAPRGLNLTTRNPEEP